MTTATRLRISGGAVYDPANGVDGAVRDVCIAGVIVPCSSNALSLAISAVGVAASACSAAQPGWVPVAPGSVVTGAMVPKAKVFAKL